MEQVLKEKVRKQDADWGNAVKNPRRNYHPDLVKDLANAAMPGMVREKADARKVAEISINI